MEKILPEEIRIEKIKMEHTLTYFISYNKELEKFLKEDALHNQDHNISLTFLWFYKSKIVSYMTLLTDRIRLQADLVPFFLQKGIHYNTLPALKIGRLCVDDRFQRRNLGKLMVYAAIEKAKYCNQEIAGCRFLTVDAKQNSVIFYEKLGFIKLEKQQLEFIPMFLDITLHANKN